MALFDRQHKGVKTTDAGSYPQEQVAMGLTLIDQAGKALRADVEALKDWLVSEATSAH